MRIVDIIKTFVITEKYVLCNEDQRGIHKWRYATRRDVIYEWPFNTGPQQVCPVLGRRGKQGKHLQAVQPVLQQLREIRQENLKGFPFQRLSVVRRLSVLHCLTSQLGLGAHTVRRKRAGWNRWAGWAGREIGGRISSLEHPGRSTVVGKTNFVALGWTSFEVSGLFWSHLVGLCKWGKEMLGIGKFVGVSM